jgi:cytochrome P450
VGRCRCPDRFDIRGPSKRILTFGRGRHSCLGFRISALEGETALPTRLERHPEYRFDEDRIGRLMSELVAATVELPVSVD